MKKRKVIIDCDPGIDDLLALSFAIHSNELEILAISTCFGNVSLDFTSRNALLIADIHNKIIPVIKGSSKPLVYNNKPTSTVHGTDGLGGIYEEYRSKTPRLNKEIEGIYNLHNLIANSVEKIDIIAVGPLTNIAKLLMIDESISDNISGIYIMGGGFNAHNTTPLTEFNFFSDSYAAKIVLSSNIPTYLSTLDVTSKIFFTKDEMDSFVPKSVKESFIKDSISFYIDLDPYMHDVVSVTTLTHPEYFKFEKCDVDILTGVGIHDGMLFRTGTNVKSSFIVDTDKRKELMELIISTISKEEE